MGSGVVPAAGWQRRWKGHVCPGYRKEHTMSAGGATDGQRVCTAQTGRELRGERAVGGAERRGGDVFSKYRLGSEVETKSWLRIPGFLIPAMLTYDH